MTTYYKSGSFGWAGGGKAGAIVDLWATSRFVSPPAQGSAPPSGSPDAGPVTTGSSEGNPGAYVVTNIPTIQDYYIRVQYGGVSYWGGCSAGSISGQLDASNEPYIIDQVQYENSAATYDVTTSLAALDTVNLTIGPFTVPPSGEILVEADVFVEVSMVTSDNIQIGLNLAFLNHSGGAVVAAVENVLENFSGSENLTGVRAHYSILVTGLTESESLQLDLAAQYTTGGGTPTAVVVVATPAFGPALLTIYDPAGQSGSGAVESVYGRSGNVVAQIGDYAVNQVTGAAPLASPALTGAPTVPTATFGDNTTKIASTGFVQAAVTSSITGVTEWNSRTGNVVPQTGDYTVAQVTGAAPLASPGLSGIPTVPTATAGTNTTQAASTAFVTTAVAGATTGVSQVTNTDGTLTISPTTGAVVASLTNPLIDLLFGVKHTSGGNAVGFDGTTNPPSTLINGVRQWAGAGTPTDPTFGILTTTHSNVGDLWYDSAASADYVCTVAGNPGTAVWAGSGLTAAAIEATFTAISQIYLGTGSATGELITLLNALFTQFTAVNQVVVGTGSGTGALTTTYAAAALTPANAQTSSYAPVIGDLGKCIEMNSTSATNVTLNTGIFAAGDTFEICQINTGTVTIVAGSGFTLDSFSGDDVLAGRWATASVRFRSGSEAVLVGNLT